MIAMLHWPVASGRRVFMTEMLVVLTSFASEDDAARVARA